MKDNINSLPMSQIVFFLSRREALNPQTGVVDRSWWSTEKGRKMKRS